MHREHISPTCSFADLNQQTWDVLVVGAGPSGSVAARQSAMAGGTVLLVDKVSFPRRKVCGCYVNGSGISTLEQIGLGTLPERLGAPRVSRVRLGANHRVAELPLPPGAAISRESFDSALVAEAIQEGVQFHPETEAKLVQPRDDSREVELTYGTERLAVKSKIVIIADGVGGQTLRDCDEIEFRIAPRSLVGASAVTDQIPTDYRPGTIHMAVGPQGYVGALQVEDGRLDIAAAFDVRSLRNSSPGELALAIREQSGLPPVEGLDELRWIGTPPLSRTPSTSAGHRFFLVGDAGGYVEPFTGEGMSWALASGRAVAPIVAQAMKHYSPNLAREWTLQNRQLLGWRKWLCRWLTYGLRQPVLARFGVRALSRLPSLAAPIVYWLNQSPQIRTRVAGG